MHTISDSGVNRAIASREGAGQRRGLAPLEQIAGLHVEQLVGLPFLVTPRVEGEHKAVGAPDYQVQPRYVCWECLLEIPVAPPIEGALTMEND